MPKVDYLMPTRVGIELFAKVLLRQDHIMPFDMRGAEYRRQVIKDFFYGHCHVFIFLVEDEFAGCSYGTLKGRNFHGHNFFLPKYRGKVALEGFREIIKLCGEVLAPKRLVAMIPTNNKPSLLFTTLAGFKRGEIFTNYHQLSECDWCNAQEVIYEF